MPAEKKKFVLRMDEAHFKLVERWANDEYRSVNGQLEWMIMKGLQSADKLKDDSKQGNRAQKDEE